MRNEYEGLPPGLAEQCRIADETVRKSLSFEGGEMNSRNTADTRHPSRGPKIVATPFVWRDPATIPRRAWLYGRHYIRKFTSCTIAPGSLGKSSLALVEAIAIALGAPLLGITPSEQTNAWYWNGEDPQEETERRIAAICKRYEIDGRELARHLFIDSGRASPIKLANVTKGGVAFDDDLVDDISATILANRIGVLILDPFISTHSVPESDNTYVDAVIKKLAHIADEANCAIEFAHHARKVANGQSETTAEDARGATAIVNAVRSARVLNRMSKDQADGAGIAEPRSYFRWCSNRKRRQRRCSRILAISIPDGWRHDPAHARRSRNGSHGGLAERPEIRSVDRTCRR
jgi:hypothetical protein